MNVFLRELKANLKALIIWCACMIVGVMGGMTKYTAYSSGGAAAKAIKDLPQSMKALMGIGNLDVTTMSGFFALLFLYFAVAAAIHAAVLGSGIIAKEERDKTAEFLNVKPVSRAAVVTYKLLAALVNIAVLNAVTLAGSVAMVAQYNKGRDISGIIAVFFLSLFVIQLIFLSLGAFISAFMKKPKGAVTLAAAAVLGAYLVYEITSVDGRLNTLSVLSPFKYFDAGRIVAGGGLSPLAVLLSFLLVAVFTALTYNFYKKRDLDV